MTIYLDFETRGVVDLKRVGATRYAMDELTQVLCFCWSFNQEPQVNLWHRDHPWIVKSEFPQELCDRIASGEIVEAHNAGFELAVWEYTLMREFPEFREFPLTLEQMRCSAAKASCMSLPRALGDALLAIHAPLEFQKSKAGERLIPLLSNPRPRRRSKRDKAEKIEYEWSENEDDHRANWKYCAQDIVAERYLSNWCPEMTPRELDYWFMDQRMNQRGIALDKTAAIVALKMCKSETERLDAEMMKITDGEVPGGAKRKKFLGWVNRQLGSDGWLPNTKADTLSFALHGVPTKAGEAAKIARAPEMKQEWDNNAIIIGTDKTRDIRRSMEICMEVNRTSNSKYSAMLNSVCPDNRLHDIMLYNGADRTGRWSGKGVQPHNFVRGYSKDMPKVWDDIFLADRDWIKVVWGDPLPVLAKACRGALVPSFGYEFYTADFNAIEARKLAWMANCISQLKLFAEKGDPYIAMAIAIYQRELNKKDNPDERQLGKRAVLGLGYAMGWEKFQTTIWNEEGIQLDDEFCQMVVSVYRKEQCPEMPVLWKDIGNAAISAVTDGGEWPAGGDPLTGQGQISYFMNDHLPFLHCRLPSGRLLAYLFPEVHTKLTWRFHATNERGKKCFVSFPSHRDAPMFRARGHAEKMAEKQRKTLLPEAPESFLSPHLSFMGRHIITKKWIRLGTHGGSLTENADQASSRDLLAEAMYRVDQTGIFRLLLSIHDEVIAEAPIGTATVEEFEALMSEVPLWAAGMPISAEGWRGPRLRK